MNKGKCQFAQETLEYLGHTISAQGISADPINIDSIRAWPKPKLTKAWCGFLRAHLVLLHIFVQLWFHCSSLNSPFV